MKGGGEREATSANTGLYWGYVIKSRWVVTETKTPQRDGRRDRRRV